MYAGKMPSGKYAALETAIEHYRSCNAALGQQDEVHAASQQLIRTLFEEGESLSNTGQLEASVAKFQQVEQGAQDIRDFAVPMQDLARQRLLEVFWKLKRYSDVDAVSDRVIAAVRGPVNDYNSVLAEEYSKLALWRSHLPDWEGMEKACTRAIEEHDKTIAAYPESDSGRRLTSNARFWKAMAMYWLALAYTNQRKQDAALSAADNAFQYSVRLHSAHQLARQIADLGLQAAKTSQQPQLITTWQERLRHLPADPCPAPNINNPNCITPAATDQPVR
jgi:tetratricopeptide (TPR) repeat protein